MQYIIEIKKVFEIFSHLSILSSPVRYRFLPGKDTAFAELMQRNNAKVLAAIILKFLCVGLGGYLSFGGFCRRETSEPDGLILLPEEFVSLWILLLYGNFWLKFGMNFFKY